MDGLPSDDRMCPPQVAPTPVFLQFARFEQYFDQEAANRYIAAARDPKMVRWYGTDHELNDPQCVHDRLAWLSERVGLQHIVDTRPATRVAIGLPL